MKKQTKSIKQKEEEKIESPVAKHYKAKGKSENKKSEEPKTENSVVDKPKRKYVKKDKPPVNHDEIIIKSLICDVRKDLPVVHFLYTIYKKITDRYYSRSMHEANKTALLIEEYKSGSFKNNDILSFNLKAERQLEINNAILTLTDNNKYVELVIATRFLKGVVTATQEQVMKAFTDGLKE